VVRRHQLLAWRPALRRPLPRRPLQRRRSGHPPQRRHSRRLRLQVSACHVCFGSPWQLSACTTAWWGAHVCETQGRQQHLEPVLRRQHLELVLEPALRHQPLEPALVPVLLRCQRSEPRRQPRRQPRRLVVLQARRLDQVEVDSAQEGSVLAQVQGERIRDAVRSAPFAS